MRPLGLLAFAAAVLLLAASPAPAPAPSGPPEANHLTAAQMKAMLPKTALRSVFYVAVNAKGQVTGAKAKQRSTNSNFDVQTYGNALQMWIRTPDGKAVSGVYSVTYDYDPKTTKVHRDVALVHAGGVDPNAEGAALVMMDAARKEAAAEAAKAKKASPAPHAQATHS
jgi:hypothetical protein